jgi:hypothetical protein
MPASPLFPLLYYLSLAVMVVGTLLGLWYFLTDDETPELTGTPTHVHFDGPADHTPEHD